MKERREREGISLILIHVLCSAKQVTVPTFKRKMEMYHKLSSSPLGTLHLRWRWFGWTRATNFVTAEEYLVHLGKLIVLRQTANVPHRKTLVLDVNSFNGTVLILAKALHSNHHINQNRKNWIYCYACRHLIVTFILFSNSLPIL